MTQLNNYSPASTFGDLLTTTPPQPGSGLNNVLAQLQDGFGNSSTITIATNAVNFNRQGGNTFQLDGVALTVSANALNAIANGTSAVFPGTAGIVVPSGTTAQRVATTGIIRFNTDTLTFEGYNGTIWITL